MECINKDIYVIRNGIFPSNTYLLSHEGHGDCLVIDPGLDVEKVMQEIAASGLRPIAILATHGHFDHIGSVSAIKEKYQVPFYLHEADLKISQSANFYLKMARIEAKVITAKPDYLFKDTEETLQLGDFNLTIYHMPGHSDGSCIIRHKDYLFTGDLLFLQGIGDDSIPKAKPDLLLRSVQNLINRFGDNDLVVPGHGPVTSLGSIKKNNLVLQQLLSKIQNNHV